MNYITQFSKKYNLISSLVQDFYNKTIRINHFLPHFESKFMSQHKNWVMEIKEIGTFKEKYLDYGG